MGNDVTTFLYLKEERKKIEYVKENISIFYLQRMSKLSSRRVERCLKLINQNMSVRPPLRSSLQGYKVC